MKQLMVMKDKDARHKLNLAAEHDFVCVVCGYHLASVACITVEHVVPKSKGASGRANKAPSHYVCNKMKGVLSLIEARVLVRERLTSLGKQWRHWLNTPCPNRIVPAEALWDPIDAGWHFYRPPVVTGTIQGYEQREASMSRRAQR